MTSKDKTRNKLVGSMRKTKAVAGAGTDSTETETAVNTSIAESKPAKHASQNDRRSGSSPRSAPAKADNYQSGRRVWPD